MTKTPTAKTKKPWREARPDVHGFEERIDRLVAALAQRALGVEPKRNTVARQALQRGLEAMERELGI